LTVARRPAPRRLLRVLLAATLAGFVLTYLLASVVPLAFGDRSLVVRSGSMTPAIDTGDIVAVHPITPATARIGDIVTFKRHGKLTSHRVRAIVRRGATLEFTTQGDANTGQEHWSVPAGGRIGRVTYRVPKLGFVVVKVQSPAGRFVLIILPALLLGLSLLRRIWRVEASVGSRDEPATP
jgi:signal peptidase I